jgi:hypothetical protein
VERGKKLEVKKKKKEKSHLDGEKASLVTCLKQLEKKGENIA